MNNNNNKLLLFVFAQRTQRQIHKFYIKQMIIYELNKINSENYKK